MNKKFLIILSVILALGVVAAGLIFLRGNEDTWICVDGHWVKHGNPSSPKPNGTEFCPDNTACTADAKICPDGSSVGRTGVDCEFAECPVATSTTQIVNPASVNCKDKGGQVVIKDGPIGQYGLCFFDDNRACEEWAMLRGDCPVGGVKTTGYDTEAQKFCAWSGGATLAQPNAICAFKDGSKCLADDFYSGKCNPGIISSIDSVATSTNSISSSLSVKNNTVINCSDLDCFLQAAKTCSPAKGVVAFKDVLVLNFLMSGKTETEIKKGDNGMCIYYQKYLEASTKYSDKLVKSLLDQGKTMAEIESMEASGNQMQQATVGKYSSCVLTINDLIKKIEEGKSITSVSGNYALSTNHDGCTGTVYENQ